MIQDEFRELVFKFAREGATEGVAHIFLFGSVAKGDADRRSDVDLLVVFDTFSESFDDLKVKDRISELALYLEREYDRSIQVVFTNKNFDGLDSYFVKKVMREGIVLFSKSPSIKMKNLELEPYALILYSFNGVDKKERLKIGRLLYGHKTKKVVKGRIYESKKSGLVQELSGYHIAPGLIAIDQKNAEVLEKRLERLNINYKRIDMWLSNDDIIKIRS
jgi:predicted nucleotidyltransferase